MIELHPKFGSNCHISVVFFLFPPLRIHHRITSFIFKKGFIQYTYLCVLFYNNSIRIFHLLFIVVWHLPFIICICTCSSSCTFFEFLKKFQIIFLRFLLLFIHLIVGKQINRKKMSWFRLKLDVVSICCILIHLCLDYSNWWILFNFKVFFFFFNKITHTYTYTHHSSQFYYHKIFNPNSNVVVDFAS